MCALKMPFQTDVMKVISVLINIPQGWSQTISIFILEILRTQSQAALQRISQRVSGKQHGMSHRLSICRDSALNSGHFEWNINFTTAYDWILKCVIPRQAVSDVVHKLYILLYILVPYSRSCLVNLHARALLLILRHFISAVLYNVLWYLSQNFMESNHGCSQFGLFLITQSF